MTSHLKIVPLAARLAGCLLSLLTLTGAALAQSGEEAADTARIVSIGGDITEILYALGADRNIVAVDATSQFPPEALQQKKNVGYMRALSTEGVLSVNASLIIASDRAGPPEVVKALKSSPVRYVEIAEDYSPEGVAKKVREVSRIVGREAEGDDLGARIARDFAALHELRAAIKTPLRALFVLNVANGRATVGGSNTSADAILKLAGAENAAASVNGFKPVTDEAMVEIDPDAIVTMQRAGEHDTGQLLELKGISASPAAAEKRVIQMDGLYLLGFGPRAPAAALELMRLLYPDLPAKRAGLEK